MYKSIDMYDFVNAFEDYNREENFSVQARQALFEYFESYEEGTGDQIELDVIAICCDWTEYESLEELVNEYMDGYEEEMKYRLPDKYEDEDEEIEIDKDELELSDWTEEEVNDAVMDLEVDAIRFMEDKTTIIELSGSYLVQNF